MTRNTMISAILTEKQQINDLMLLCEFPFSLSI